MGVSLCKIDIMTRCKEYLPLLSFMGAGCSFLVYVYWDKIKGRLRYQPEDDDVKEKTEDEEATSSTKSTNVNTSKNQDDAVFTIYKPVNDNLDDEDAEGPQQEQQDLKHARQTKREKKEWNQKKTKRTISKRNRVNTFDGPEIFTSYLGGQEFKSICKLVPVEELQRRNKQKEKPFMENNAVPAAGEPMSNPKVEPVLENNAGEQISLNVELVVENSPAAVEEMSLKVEPVMETDDAAAAGEDMSLKVEPVMANIATAAAGEETILKLEPVMDNIATAAAGEEMISLKVEPVMENIASAAAGGEEMSLKMESVMENIAAVITEAREEMSDVPSAQ